MKSVLILLLLASISMAWFSGKLTEAKSEADFLARLSSFCERQGLRARHKYDYELVKHDILMKSRREPYGPRWIRSLFGEHVFSRIHELQISAEFDFYRRQSAEVEKDFKALNLKSLRCLKRLQFSGLRRGVGGNDGYSDSMLDILKKEAPRKLLKDLSLISDLSTLEHLGLESWSTLESLDGIEQLSQLKTIVGGSGLDSLVDVEALKELQNLEMIKLAVGDDFASSENWDALSSKPNLIELSVRNANRPSVNEVGPVATSAFISSPRLELLSFDKVDPGLENLRCCEDMPKLRSLRIVASPTLKSLDGIEQCHGLTHLVIHDCPNLGDVKGIEKLRNLEVLSISSTRKLSLPVLQCRDLKGLSLRDVDGFEDLGFLENMQNLKMLDVSNSGLRSLRGLSHLSSLEQLLTSGSRLESIGCEEEFTSPLDCLYLGHSKNLVDLSGIQNCKSVKTVKLNGCTQLERLAGLGQMTSLENLDLSGCTALKNLDDLEAVPRLHHLIVDRCSNLSDVSALSHVNNLRIFEWEDCPKLKAEHVEPLRQKFDLFEAWPNAFGPLQKRADFD